VQIPAKFSFVFGGLFDLEAETDEDHLVIAAAYRPETIPAGAYAVGHMDAEYIDGQMDGDVDFHKAESVVFRCKPKSEAAPVTLHIRVVEG